MCCGFCWDEPSPGALTFPPEVVWRHTCTQLRARGRRFVTTLHSINSGIQKLSQLTPSVVSYRGTSGMKMPKQLLEHDALGSRLGIDFAFISTSTDKAVAMHYGKDWDQERGLSYLLEFHMDSLNKACPSGARCRAGRGGQAGRGGR